MMSYTMACTCLCSSGSTLMRRTSPCTRIIGGRPADRCRSDALFLTLERQQLGDVHGVPWRCCDDAFGPALWRRFAKPPASARADCTRPVPRADAPCEASRCSPCRKTFRAARGARGARGRAARFGENYVQEGARQDRGAAPTCALRIEWHCIGPLQSNKTREVAAHFDWVHSARPAEDRASACREQRPGRPAAAAGLPAGQHQRRGRASAACAPEDVPALARAVAALPRLTLRGLMAIPEPAADFEAQRRPHRALRELFDALRARRASRSTRCRSA